jgi:hypothetical protein
VELYGKKYYFLDRGEVEIFKQRKTDKRNIFVTGDSFVQSHVCAYEEEDFPSYLQQKLGNKYRVVNIGGGLV